MKYLDILGELEILFSMKYQYYHNGELSQGLTLAELKNRVTPDELVKDETGKWQPAQDLTGWHNVAESATPIQEMDISSVSVNSTENDTTELLRKEAVQSDVVPDELPEKDNFKYQQPSGFWKYFGYDDEYISGGTYLARMILQSFLAPVFGIGLYLVTVTTFKRARSLGAGGGAGFIAFLMVAYWIVVYGNSMNESANRYNAYYRSEPETNIALGLFSLFMIVIHWWLTLKNSREIMLGGPKALLRSLKVYDPNHREELLNLLDREQELRDRSAIPEEVMVVPCLIPKKGAAEYQRYFETESYYLAVRDSTTYYALTEINDVAKPSRLIKKTMDTTKELEEFKKLVSFKR